MFVRKHRILGVALAALVATTGLATSASAAAPERDRALTKAVRAAMKDAAAPGAIVGVWQKGEKPYVRAFGVRDTATKRRMTTNLHMRIGSETKTFTVTALLQLAAQGKLGLDDPIGRYVPGVVNGDTATLRELASMTSGIPSYTQVEPFFHDLTSDPLRSFTPQQLLAYVAGEPALFPPGEGFDYSNTNTVLLGLVIEQVSGQSLPAYVEEHILKPLGMRDTAFPTDSAFASPHAHGYTEQTADGQRADATDWNPSWGLAAGAMTSTVHDLRIWAEHLVTGRKLLPRSLQRVRLASVRERPGAPNTYGIGMFSVAGWKGHNGSLPGYQTVVIHRPASKATVVVLTNTDIPSKGRATSTVLGKAVTSLVTPRHVYDLPASPAG